MTFPVIHIESLDHEGRGVGRVNGKAIFVEGALIGEEVRFHSHTKKDRYEFAETVEVIRESSQRVIPPCPYFGECGGCSMQHLNGVAQVSAKQRVLEDSLQRIGKVKLETIFRPIHGPAWHYRNRTRLAVHQYSDSTVKIGYRKRKSHELVDIQSCLILKQTLSNLIAPLHDLLNSIITTNQVDEIELVETQSVAVVLLHIKHALTHEATAQLKVFANQFCIQFWLSIKQNARAELKPINENSQLLAYQLMGFAAQALKLNFLPADFIQVNAAVNQIMVKKAVELLELTSEDRVADLFCGVGNFSLALALNAREVIGIEGDSQLTQRAKKNALENGLDKNTKFLDKNLFEITEAYWKKLGHLNKILIDPPRDGAQALVEVLSNVEANKAPQKIVYVSCNPSTLARDASILTKQGRYLLRGAGVINMFPQTSHVESIAVFEKL